MSRAIDEVLASGHVTIAERLAMDFVIDLEANEKTMGEGAALAVTCEQHGIEVDDYAELLLDLPDGEWWKADKLPVKDMGSQKRTG